MGSDNINLTQPRDDGEQERYDEQDSEYPDQKGEPAPRCMVGSHPPCVSVFLPPNYGCYDQH